MESRLPFLRMYWEKQAAAFRPFRARYIRLGGYLGFRSATPQAITLRAFSPGITVHGNNKVLGPGMYVVSPDLEH